MRSEFQAVPFDDLEKAELNLARLEQQLAPTLMVPLASLLAHSPDPDGALNLLERYAQEAPADVLGEIARYPVALSYLVAIFGYSGFLAETCCPNRASSSSLRTTATLPNSNPKKT